MKQEIKPIESIRTFQAHYGAHQEIAIYIRDLLKCDYALVAMWERDSIRIQGFAGPYSEMYGNLASDTIRLVLDWGPVVADDARLIAVPVPLGEEVIGVLVGYSSRSGAFTSCDLEKLMTYSHVAAGILTDTAIEENSEVRTSITNEELLHFSRLITMGELSACFAHEVTNPLTLIRGHLRFIEESLAVNHPLRSNFEALDRAARRIEELAKRMLDFSKKKTHRLGRCDIAELVADALRFVQPYFRTSSIEVQVHIEPQLPAILADRWQMVQAIVNLLQNAADAMADLERRVLSITAVTQAGEVQIALSDTGKGIAPGHISKIFDLFFTTKGDRGTGIGLYIARQVIEEHRGTINVETGDHGTSFIISLPL
jgi:signal transduction histidine kinase